MGLRRDASVPVCKAGEATRTQNKADNRGREVAGEEKPGGRLGAIRKHEVVLRYQDGFSAFGEWPEP